MKHKSISFFYILSVILLFFSKCSDLQNKRSFKEKEDFVDGNDIYFSFKERKRMLDENTLIFKIKIKCSCNNGNCKTSPAFNTNCVENIYSYIKIYQCEHRNDCNYNNINNNEFSCSSNHPGPNNDNEYGVYKTFKISGIDFDINCLFKGLSGLFEVEIIDYSGRSQTNLSEMFSGCSQLETVKFNNKINGTQITSLENMFKGCGNLRTVSFGNSFKSNVEEVNYKGMFDGCNRIQNFNLNELKITYNGDNNDNYKIFENSNCDNYYYYYYLNLDEISKIPKKFIENNECLSRLVCNNKDLINKIEMPENSDYCKDYCYDNSIISTNNSIYRCACIIQKSTDIKLYNYYSYQCPSNCGNNQQRTPISGKEPFALCLDIFTVTVNNATYQINNEHLEDNRIVLKLGISDKCYKDKIDFNLEAKNESISKTIVFNCYIKNKYYFNNKLYSCYWDVCPYYADTNCYYNYGKGETPFTFYGKEFEIVNSVFNAENSISVKIETLQRFKFLDAPNLGFIFYLNFTVNNNESLNFFTNNNDNINHLTAKYQMLPSEEDKVFLKFNSFFANSYQIKLEVYIQNLNAKSLFENSIYNSIIIESREESKFTNMLSMFKNSKKLENVEFSEKGDTVESIKFNEMFAGCSNLINVKFNDNFDSSKLIQTDSMFLNCISLTSLELNLKNNNIVSAKNMFKGCTGLYYFKFNEEFTKLTKAKCMFQNCKNLTYINSDSTENNFILKEIQSADEMFSGCTSLTSVILKIGDKSLKTINKMFYDCKELHTVLFEPMTSSYTSKSLQSTQMFEGCSELKSVNLKLMSNILTKSSKMFKNCIKLEMIDFNDIFTSSENDENSNPIFFADVLNDASEMFSGCESLTYVSSFNLYPTNYNTEPIGKLSLENINGIYKDCTNLLSLDITLKNAKELTTASELFSNCQQLTSVTLNFSGTNKLKDISKMFNNCKNLRTMNVDFPADVLDDSSEMFNECDKIVSITFGNDFLPYNLKKVGNMFYNCKSLCSLNLTNFNLINLPNLMINKTQSSSLFGTFDCSHMIITLNEIDKLQLESIHCNDECIKGEEGSTNRCRRKESYPYYYDDIYCTSECLAPKEYLKCSSCESSCPYYTLGNKCVTFCPTPTTLNSKKQCICNEGEYIEFIDGVEDRVNCVTECDITKEQVPIEKYKICKKKVLEYTSTPVLFNYQDDIYFESYPVLIKEKIYSINNEIKNNLLNVTVIDKYIADNNFVLSKYSVSNVLKFYYNKYVIFVFALSDFFLNTYVDYKSTYMRFLRVINGEYDFCKLNLNGYRYGYGSMIKINESLFLSTQYEKKIIYSNVYERMIIFIDINYIYNQSMRYVKIFNTHITYPLSCTYISNNDNIKCLYFSNEEKELKKYMCFLNENDCRVPEYADPIILSNNNFNSPIIKITFREFVDLEKDYLFYGIIPNNTLSNGGNSIELILEIYSLHDRTKIKTNSINHFNTADFPELYIISEHILLCFTSYNNVVYLDFLDENLELFPEKIETPITYIFSPRLIDIEGNYNKLSLIYLADYYKEDVVVIEFPYITCQNFEYTNTDNSKIISMSVENVLSKVITTNYSNLNDELYIRFLNNLFSEEDNQKITIVPNISSDSTLEESDYTDIMNKKIRIKDLKQINFIFNEDLNEKINDLTLIYNGLYKVIIPNTTNNEMFTPSHNCKMHLYYYLPFSENCNKLIPIDCDGSTNKLYLDNIYSDKCFKRVNEPICRYYKQSNIVFRCPIQCLTCDYLNNCLLCDRNNYYYPIIFENSEDSTVICNSTEYIKNYYYNFKGKFIKINDSTSDLDSFNKTIYAYLRASYKFSKTVVIYDIKKYPSEKFNDSFTQIDLKECASTLKNSYNINEHDDIYLFQIETKKPEYTTSRFNIYFFDLNGTELNLSKCINITAYETKKLDSKVIEILSSNFYNGLKQKYDILVHSSSLYNDRCTQFTSLEGTDMILEDREQLYSNSVDFCDEGFSYFSINLDKQTVTCKCNSIGDRRVKAEVIKTNNKKKSFFEKNFNSNVYTVKCIKMVFDSKIIKKNYGFWFTFVTIVFSIVVVIIKEINGYDDLSYDIISYVEKFLKNNTPKTQYNQVNNDNKSSNSIKERKNSELHPPKKQQNLLIFSDLSKNEFFKENQFDYKRIVQGYNTSDNIKNSISSENKNRKNSFELKVENIEEYSNEEINLNEGISDIINNNGIYLKNIDREIEKNNKKLNSLNKELNYEYKESDLLKNINIKSEESEKTEINNYFSLDEDEKLNKLNFKHALLYDKRTLMEMYYGYLKYDQQFIFTFSDLFDFNIKSMKVMIFIYTIPLCMAMIILTYNESTLTHILNKKGKYYFKYHIPKIFLSLFITKVLLVIIRFLFLTKRCLKNIIHCEKNSLKEKKLLLNQFWTNIRIRIIIFYVFYYVTLLFIFYYISSFCAVFHNTQRFIFLDTLICYTFGICLPFITCFFSSYLRYIGIQNKSFCSFNIGIFIGFFSIL